MIYLREFNNHSAYEAAESGLTLPNVSYCISENEVHYKPYDYSKDYLTFRALESGTFTLTIGSSVTTSMLESVSYSTNNGDTWTTTNNVNDQTVTITTPTVNEGNKVLWKGVGTQMSNATTATTAANRPALSSIFSSSGEFDIEGNIMSLLYGDDFEDKKSFAEGSSSNFALLFYSTNVGPAKVVSAKNMSLPAMVMKDNGYIRMFQGCTSLTTAPELPATTLAEGCYLNMFYKCRLNNAPKLLATTLKSECYNGMFQYCTSLTTAPALPATALTSNCYKYMFNSCTSLTTAPELPATTLASNCYQYMFSGCTSLITAPSVLPATTLADNCYQFMFDCCTSLTTAPELPATTLASKCYQYMFSNCSSLTTAPELPATALTSNCYNYMFYRCTSLNYIKAMFTTTPSTSYMNSWVYGVASSGTFVKNSAATWTDSCGVSTYPCDWTVQTASS